jgi:asparagine synthase (glutamine-hydrolysing)
MCGIAGAYGRRLPSADALRAASAALAHRGPDGEGLYTNVQRDHAIALVHRRLAILDLHTRSDQPFRFGDGVLAYNGEIYNYVELRTDLQGLGHVFQTTGDTEVLAHALQEWGEDALDRLEGMWALAWYDERRATLLLSRDRFGEKPLYLWKREGVLYFASEVKGLAALAGSWPSVNEDHLVRYLINGYKALYKTAETFYRGVEELPAATCLSATDGVVAGPRRYWTPAVAPDEELSYQDAVSATREAVIKAVRLRLRSDVPLAFCMSGGVDSNTLIATAQRVLNCQVHGFTIVNTDARYDEQALVDVAVQELGIRHTPIRLEQRSFLGNLRRLVASHDAPVYTISYYVQWQLMAAIAAEGYKVTISGTGADELFTGYYDHHNLYLYEVRRDPTHHAAALAAWRMHQASVVRNPFLQDPDLYLKDPTRRDHIYLKADVFAGWLRQPWAEPFVEVDYGAGLLRNRMLNELFAEAVPVILHEDDLNAMSFSMENRSPFLDRGLFETAYRVPVRHLVQDGRAKAVLRDAMRGIVPDAVLDSRRKVGFNAPILELLDARDPEVRATLLDDSPIFDLVKKEKIEALLDEATLENSASKVLFSFVNMKMFLEQQAAVA